ncbi:hypothetical protein DCAR_0206356 [Daucus carota subsp. sativus]|uniref:Uncharacterized protein n=1 Tax=Daucus carota subsp. sativus TaxID=79200 RepID=A0AAF1ALI7_DAUCS|nr:hypothetical protein DCAR_0206356 [Daucus carota subsp. sativus]
MNGRRGHWDPRSETGAPFAGFDGPRGRQIPVPGVFGAHDPFDHPFFTDPFGLPGRVPLMNTPLPGVHMGRSPVMPAPMPHFPIDESPFNHAHLPNFHFGGHPFMNTGPTNFPIGNNPFSSSPLPFGFGTEISAMNVQAPEFIDVKSSQMNRSKGPIIEELNSDDEKEMDDQEEKNGSKGPIIEELSSDDEKEIDDLMEKNDNPRKHDRRRKEAYAEDQDYQTDGMNKRQMLFCNKSNSVNNAQLSGSHSSQSFTFHSSTVMHGGSNGTYYTKSRTLRRGTDGLMIDESKEADFTTGRAAHRLSRAINDKGHTVARNLQSDGNVDTMQILHNLEKDDLATFEQTWNQSASKSSPGWSEGLYMQNGSGSSREGVLQRRAIQALPSTENPHILGGTQPGVSSRPGYSEFHNPERMDVNNGGGGNSFGGRF